MGRLPLNSPTTAQEDHALRALGRDDHGAHVGHGVDVPGVPEDQETEALTVHEENIDHVLEVGAEEGHTGQGVVTNLMNVLASTAVALSITPRLKRALILLSVSRIKRAVVWLLVSKLN